MTGQQDLHLPDALVRIGETGSIPGAARVLNASRASLLESIAAVEDGSFDRVYPPRIRALSAAHWTPVSVARRAAEFLVSMPGTRVLDIGCGPAKFCIVGALSTPGVFTGVDQRRQLCELGRSIIEGAGIGNATVLQANIRDIPFQEYDAFYLFNPFAENLDGRIAIDGTVALCAAKYHEYTEDVARKLALAPIGTRVATYYGACEEVPMGYECVGSALTSELRFWKKTTSDV